MEDSVHMNIVIRPVDAHADYQAIEHVQRQAWSMPDVEVVPGSLLRTAQRHGGLVLGAFTPDEQVIGFAFGFLGRDARGRLHHHSHQTAVLPTLQHNNIGYRLKLAQRDHVLQQGINLITWTFDPLQSRNAYLNLHKLGAICHTYLPDAYGSMPDALNAGLPSDRFEVEWHLRSRHVAQRLQPAPANAPAQRVPSIPVLNPVPPDDLADAATAALLQGQPVLLEIPANLDAIKAANMEHARRWRLHTRTLFQAAFAAGYTATDLVVHAGRSYYLLEHEGRPDEDRTR
jgi:predicted GNAT superfamily acetyltransferase